MKLKSIFLKEKFPIFLLILFLLFSVLMGMDPKYRYVWFVENIILIIFLLFMVFTYRYFKFSNISYFLIFLFCIFQTIGAHYSYAQVPIGFWIQNLLELDRNHYDRLVHFLFGFLLTYPFREFFIMTSKVKRSLWSFAVPVLAAFACGAIYEILEWLATVTILKPSVQSADLFLGAQGDIWDAEKDMFLVGFGGFLAMIFNWFVLSRK